MSWSEEVDTIHQGDVHSPVYVYVCVCVRVRVRVHVRVRVRVCVCVCVCVCVYANIIYMYASDMHNHIKYIPVPPPPLTTPPSFSSHLPLGARQSDPYSWTYIPKKQTSTPSIFSNTNIALVRYGKDSGKSP